MLTHVICAVYSLHVALQLNWILVAALEDYHAELPDGSRNKKANSVYFNRCAKLLQVRSMLGFVPVAPSLD